MKLICNLSEGTCYVNEPLVKHYKNFIKSLYGDDIQPQIFVEGVLEFIGSTIDHPIEWIKKLSTFDLICILLELRINSLGEICQINLTSEKKKPQQVNLNLSHIKEDILALSEDTNILIETETIRVHLKCPTIERLLDVYQEENCLFLYKVEIFNSSEWKELIIKTNKEADTVFNYLPPKVALEVMENVRRVTEQLFSTNHLARYRISEPQMLILPTMPSLIWFIKLIYGESLETFYNNFFQLSYSGHMNAAYLEAITVGEYGYFLSCLKKALSQSSKDGSELKLAEDAEENENGFE